VASEAACEVGREALVVSDHSHDFAEIVRRYGVRVWRSLRYLGVREADVADASQEVFLIVHRRLPEFRGESKVETWLYGICLGVARNLRRKQAKSEQRGEDAPEQSSGPMQEVELERRRMQDALRQALRAIPVEQREVFVLHEVEEMGMRDVAHAVGCPLFTAYSRLRLARRALRKHLEGEGVSP
jgi:RNA polymerase sigma-70 factor (ECF subfamily)